MMAIELSGASRWLVAGEWRAHPARLVVAVLAIAVGVALGFAVHLVNAAALASFSQAVSTVSGAADVQVRSVAPVGVDEALYPRLARLPGVAAVSPVVELRGRFAGEDGARLTLLGIDPLRAARVTPGLIGRPVGGAVGAAGNPLADDVVYLSRAAMRAAAVQPGDTVRIVAAGRVRALRVAGVMTSLPGMDDDAALAVMDIAGAQWRFGQTGRLQRFDLALEDGVSRAQLLAALAAALPAGAEIVRAEDEARRSASLSRAYRVNLGMLAMVALLTGGFLVFSAQSLSVARRVPQFALLRVLGMPRAGLRGQLLGEGLVLGLAGASLGVALGYALAAAVLGVLGGDLGGGYFSSGRARLSFEPWAAAGFAALGVAVALVSSWWPAEAAARAQPAVALKAGGEAGDPRRRWPWWPGALLLGAGGLAALAPPLWGLPLFGYAAMALLLAGGVAIMPWLARALVAPALGLRWPVPVDLALKRLWGAPSAAAVALSGIVASTSLMVAMAVMVESFRGSVDAWLGQLLPADVYLHIEGAEAGGLDRAVQARLAALPGVTAVRFVRQMPVKISPDQPAVVLSGQPIRDDPEARLPLIGDSLPVPPGAVPVWVSEPMAWLHGLARGQTVTLPVAGEVFVAGIWRDYARQFGAVAMEAADFEAATGDLTKTEAAFTLAPGQAAAPVMRAVRAALPEGLDAQAVIAEPRVMRAQALAIFDRSFLVTYALEVIAILIGLVGVATAFSAQTLARTREFGMMRHLGVTPRQIGWQLASEGAALGLLGGVAGVALGLVMAQVLIQVVNPQSFHWTMETRLPWPLMAGLVAALMAAAAGTAVLAGRRALSGDAVKAVRDDW
ncbi:MAG: FtsX-like permease family protein [Polymorphobacter sp.]|uniref:FtsX-like permease family protein n=1 Tax=Polymorphobacter sp. TaxID=1909290 RepID=UPI003A872E96